MVLKLIKSLSLRGLFLALFLMPSLANSSDIYQSSITGSYYASVTAACDAGHAVSVLSGYEYPSGAPTWEGWFWACYITHTAIGTLQSVGAAYPDTGACPTGTTDNGSGTCVEDVIDCSSFDSKYFETTDVILSQEYLFIDGCYYVSTGVLHVTPDFTQDTGFGDIPTKAEYELVPQNAEPTTLTDVGTTGTNTGSATDTQQQSGTNSHAEQRPESNSTVNAPTITTTDNNGTVTSQDSTVTTQTTGENLTISENNDFIFIQESNGTTTVLQKDTVTISNPDGSATVTESETNTLKLPDTTSSTIPKGNGTAPIVTNTTGDTINQGSVTNVYNYGTDGSLTDATSTSDTGDADVLDEEGNATYQQNGTEKGNFTEATTQTLSDIEQAKADLTAAINNIKSEASSLITFTGSGTGALPCFADFAYSLGTIGFCFTNYEDELSPLVLMLSFIFAIISLAIILR